MSELKKSVAIVIECENAAFGDTPAQMNEEVVKILTDLCGQIERNHSFNPTFTIRDGNGNKVGYIIVRHGPATEIAS